MRLLFTNNTLAKPAGTELAIRDLCREMRRRGHEVAAFSTQWGDIAETLRGEGIPVVGDPGAVPWTPEVIHGHHEWETGLAALRWPGTPVLSFCRGLEAWQEAPCRAPNVVRWVAIDEPCRRRVLAGGTDPARVSLVLNGIDLERFRPRGPLPERPAKALVFSNYASTGTFLPLVEEACRLEGIACEAIGAGVGRVVERPEEILGGYDLVFAKGKAALESVITGCAVVVCDVRGLGPLVTGENFGALRRESFGYPSMTDELTVANLRARLTAWSAESAAAASAEARATCGSAVMFDALESLYREAAAAGLTRPAAGQTESWTAFAADFLLPKSLAYKAGRELLGYHRSALGGGEAPDSVPEASREHDRLLDAYRKGQAAREELKRQAKLARKEKPVVKKKRGLFG